MPITVSHVPAPASDPNPRTSENTNGDPRVDELVELLNWEKTLKTELAKSDNAARLKELKALARDPGFLGSEDETVPVRVQGVRYGIEYGPAPEQRAVTDVKAIFEMLGEDFWGIATVSLKDCDEYLTPAQRDRVITTTRGGARRVKKIHF